MDNRQKKSFDQLVMEQRRQQKKRETQNEYIMRLKEEDLDITTMRAIVNEKEVAFFRMDMVEEHISMIVPQGMKEIPEEILETAYQEGYIPQYAYAMQDASIQINYDLLFSETDEESFEIIRNEMLLSFRQSYQDFSLSLQKTENSNGAAIYYFVKKQKTETGMIYSLTYFFLVEEYLVMGSIQCAGHRLRDWKEILFQMMCSVEVRTQEMEGGK